MTPTRTRIAVRGLLGAAARGRIPRGGLDLRAGRGGGARWNAGGAAAGRVCPLGRMVHHPGQVPAWTMLVERIWDFDVGSTTGVVDVRISQPRPKTDHGLLNKEGQP